ncbi:snRNP-associated protein-like protein [Emericellopsis cladophorae]|uniref:SnRNP-associated protein-like protein n=1 Tax=Emericellopsis cladophorae TaxID=2686198 RepID=A0A9P9XY34_9HYPO|nr:snRNP-associated protein-like protein [Emericellopsis cladophorae]KAI6779761.1 snRNP-associated protein-like protein [Emericellopsis cladophorae]
MSSAPGMAPPGLQQHDPSQANRPSGMPRNFQAPTNMPNINFNAPVIRLGTGPGKPGTPGMDNERPQGPGQRPGLGMDRGGHHQSQAKEVTQVIVPPTSEERVRTLFVWGVPESFNTSNGIEKLLGSVGKLRRWDASASVLEERKGTVFGFALYDDPESLSTAIKLLHDETVEIPAKIQPTATEPPTEEEEETFEGKEKVRLQVSVDSSSQSYLESYQEEKGDEEEATQRYRHGKAALRQVVKELFYPPAGLGADSNGNAPKTESGDNVEVVNITLAQDDELSDIPAEMREVVAGEIAAFRERSIQRDLERLRKEEEAEEMERQRNNPARASRLESTANGGSTNNIPLGPRGGMPNAPSGPRGHDPNRIAFVNGGVSNAEYSINREDEDTDADDDELYRRQEEKKRLDADRAFAEAERKWVGRERARQNALDRENDRDKQQSETFEERKREQLDRERKWDDEEEMNRREHPYYRDHVGWVRKREMNRAEEDHRDDLDRRAEQDERRREQANRDRARGMADSFLDRQAEELEQRPSESVSAPQPFKLSLGAAAQKAQASKAVTQRRTIAEVEGLLDDEEADTGVKRQLIPIQYDSTSAAANMTDEEIALAVRALAQEIPTDKDGLWNWQVKWDFMDAGVVRDKLRPFVEKKIVEYLGVQEEMLVETVEEHLRNHGTAAALAEELEGALDDEAEDLVKKLWRMVIFFTECEKRGLPA